MAVFKWFKSFLNIFQKDGFKNKMLFCPRLLFLKGISKVICDLVSYVFLVRTKCLFT